MKFLYWNTNKSAEIGVIIELLRQESPDLFFLSETDKTLLANGFESLEGIGYEYFDNPGCERVSILKKKELEVDLGIQNKYYTALKLGNYETFVVSIHLPSQMYRHMNSLKEIIRDFRADIDLYIGDSVEKSILIIGDFNVNPYEQPMVDFDGFLANNSTDSRSQITHAGKSKSSYYNPTWKLYGRKKFPGTKYYPRPSASSYDIMEFHFLDQVVVSQCLLNNIIEEKIEIIEQIGDTQLLFDGSKSIEISDHLPLSYQYKIR